jgi:diguanylate cyclase (GGDEF)-like protein
MLASRVRLVEWLGLTGAVLAAAAGILALARPETAAAVAILAGLGAAAGTAGFILRRRPPDQPPAPAPDTAPPPSPEGAAPVDQDAWRQALDALGEGVWEWFPATGRMRFSEGWRAMLALTGEDTVDTVEKWAERIHPEDWVRTLDDMESHLAGNTGVYENEHRALCGDGTYKWVLDRGIVVARDGECSPLHLIGVRTDISSRKEMEDQLWRQAVELSDANGKLAEMAITDMLTGLRNRRGFMRFAECELATTVAAQGRLGIVFMDIDHFKRINDTYGHEAGDSVLCSVAERLAAHAASPDHVARIGGEEFALFLPGADCAAATVIADAARQAIAGEPVVMPDGRGVTVTASFGVTCTGGADTLSAVLSRADLGLYQAKDAGRNRVRAACKDHVLAPAAAE